MGAVASTFAKTLAVFVRGLLSCSLIVAGARVALAQAPPADAPKTAPEPAPQGAEAPAAPPHGRVTETPAIVIDGNAAQTLLGKPVQSLKGEDLGRVVDVVVDRSGVLRAAIVDFGGFLGVGMRKIAVDWRMLHLPTDGPMNKLIVDLQRDQLRNAPAYKDGEPIVVIGAAAAPPAEPVPPPAPAPAPAPKP
jgi:hypothetical protein